MKILILKILFVLSPLVLYSQNWTAVGNQNFNLYPRTFYNDTVNNLFYIGGNFTKIGSLSVNGICTWDGNNYSNLGNGINSSGNPVFTIIRYKGEIYAGGLFENGLKKFDGTNWVQLGSGIGQYSVVSDLMVYNNELYVAGGFDSAGGIPAAGIAKWDGNNWSVFTTPLPGDHPWISSMAFYNNEFYVGGGFGLSINGGLQGVARWDGTAWQPLGEGIKGTYGQVSKIIVYKGELYAANGFLESEGNIASFIQKWNGTSWSKVGYGLFGINFISNGQVNSMEVINNELYVVGTFKYADSIPAQFIAKWDGSRWCGFGSNFDYSLDCIVSYNNDIYIGGSFWTIDGDSIKYIAKWTGGNYVDTCGIVHSNGVKKTDLQEANIAIYPNPANTFVNLQIELKEKLDFVISIYNCFGEKVFEEVARNKTGNFSKNVNLSGLSSGIYIVNISINGKLYNKKLIKL